MKLSNIFTPYFKVLWRIFAAFPSWCTLLIFSTKKQCSFVLSIIRNRVLWYTPMISVSYQVFPSLSPPFDGSGSSGSAGPQPAPSTASGSVRGGGSRTFFPRNTDYQGGSDSRYRRDRWDSVPYQFTRGGNRGWRGRGGKRGSGYMS